MESRARILGHPMLVVFPTALLPLLALLDVLWYAFGDDALWTAGFWIAAAGVATTLAAMAPGLVDMAAIPDGTKAHRTAVFHVVVGVTVLLAYAASLWARWPAGSAPDGVALATGIDVAGVLLVTVQGWLGGELVYKHHVGVPTSAEGAEPVALTGSESPDAATGASRRRGASPP
ncbi:MAG TPA: DUF2231 domain-containing protein [Candidatus Thermoplasmatota archaeon]|nr:DUF2231 domain-containing protein [Candidatus Thermoplasmatota archaeon]